MNFKTTLVLLVLLLVVGSYFVFVESRSVSTYEREKRAAAGGDKKGTPLFEQEDLSADSIVTVTIENSDGVITLAKEGADWWQTEPVRHALNSWDAAKIPKSAADLRYVEKFKPANSGATSLEKLQLAPRPRAMATLQPVEGGKPDTVVLRLGRTLVGHGYLMIEGDPLVYVVGSDLHDLILDQSVNDWRKTSIDGVKAGQADHVRVEHGGTSFEISKAQGDWSLMAPHSGRVDRKAVEDLLNDVDGIYVSKFIVDRPDDLSIYGLDAPSRVVVIRKPAPQAPATQPADGATPGGAEVPARPTICTLRIGSPLDLKKEEFFATWDRDGAGGDVVFSITSSYAEKLAKAVDDMRDPRLTTIDVSDISQLKIVAAGQEDRYLARNDDRWQFEKSGDPGFAADDVETARLLETLTDAKAVGYRPDVEPGSTVAATVTLGAVARPDPDVLRVYTDVDGEPQHHLVIRNNETTGYLVGSDDLSGLFGPLSDLRDRIVLGIPGDAVERMTLNRPDGIEFAFERDLETTGENEQPTTAPAVGRWKLVGHEKFESTALDNLLNGLAPLRATKWLTASASFDQAHRLVVHVRDGDEVALSIDVASRTVLGAGIDMPFEVDASFTDAVDAEFRHRTVLPLSTTDIESVSVNRGGATLLLKKDENNDFVGDGAEQIDQSAAGGLFDTLAGLRIERHLPNAASDVDVGITITVTLKNAQLHVVKVAVGGQEPPLVTVGPRVFTVSREVFEKLTTPLVEKEEDDK